MAATDTHRAIEAVWRIESPRLIAGLVRLVRDVGVAEDLAQDALVAALEQWPRTGVPANPGCVVPSRTTGSVIGGRMDAGTIVWTPAPGMSNAIVSSVPTDAFESRIAWRSDPAPESAVVVTVIVAARAAPGSARGRARNRSVESAIRRGRMEHLD